MAGAAWPGTPSLIVAQDVCSAGHLAPEGLCADRRRFAGLHVTLASLQQELGTHGSPFAHPPRAGVPTRPQGRPKPYYRDSTSSCKMRNWKEFLLSSKFFLVGIQGRRPSMDAHASMSGCPGTALSTQHRRGLNGQERKFQMINLLFPGSSKIDERPLLLCHHGLKKGFVSCWFIFSTPSKPHSESPTSQHGVNGQWGATVPA